MTRQTVKNVPHVIVDSIPAGSAGLTDAELRATDLDVVVTNIPHVVVDSMPAGGAGLTDLELRATPVPVLNASLPLPTGASTAALQTTGNVSLATVAGAVAGTEMQVDVLTMPSVAVTGTFFQATQPVSGTFFQATQPVSGTVTANAGTNLNTSALALEAGGNLAGTATSLAVIDDWDESDRCKTNPIVGQTGLQGASGTVSANTLRVVLATDVALPAGTNAIGKLSANSGVDIGDVDVTSIAAGTNRLGSVRLVDSADADLTSVVGTQTSRFVGVQSSTDAGRTEVRFYAVAAAAGTTTTETAITLTRSSGTAATTTGTSFVLTTGKRLRITHISVATRGHATATIQTTTFNFRLNTAGAVTTSSTPIILAVRSATPTTASAWDRYMIDFGEGMEILGNGTIQFGVTAAATYTTNAPTWDVTIAGYEY